MTLTLGFSQKSSIMTKYSWEFPVICENSKLHRIILVLGLYHNLGNSEFGNWGRNFGMSKEGGGSDFLAKQKMHRRMHIQLIGLMANTNICKR